MNKYGLTFLSLFLVFATYNVKAEEFEDAKIYHSVYETVQQNYVHPISVSDIALNTIKGITKLDPKIKIADDEKRVSLYYNARIIKSFLKPQNPQDIDAVVLLTEKMIKAAQAVSSKAKEKDFETLDTLLEYGITNGLDGDSHYYSTLSDEQKSNKTHRRNFAKRMIDDVLYVKIIAINQFTKDSLVKALQDNSNAKGLILDLRNSPGGIFGEALEIVDLFLDDGIVASAHNRDETEIKYYNSQAGDDFEGKPVIVLVDGNTSSSAEIIAAALKEQGRAKLVGTNSYGKGTRQDLFELENGAELGITTAYFYTPSESKLDKVGIKPDICTFNMDDGRKEQDVIFRLQPENCPKEDRSKAELDIQVALQMIKNRL